MKTILAPLFGGTQDKIVLEAAGSVARRLDSHIRCLHVRPNAVEQGMGITLGLGAQSEAFWNELEQEIKRNANDAHDSFEAFRDRSHLPIVTAPTFVRGPSAGWEEIEGHLMERIIAYTHSHDLAILTRGDSFALSPAEAGEILMSTGRSILLIPSPMPAQFGENVCISWKNSPESAHALMAAMPFIEKARKVSVLSAVEEGNAEDTVASLEHVADYLRWHSIEPEVRCLAPLRQSATLALTDSAKNMGADLLVMGAYGHSRAREYLFGGMTREILESCEIPVLMAH